MCKSSISKSKITKSKNITTIAVITLDCIEDHVLANSLAAPLVNIETPFSEAFPLILGIISFSIIETASSNAILSSGLTLIEIACLPPSLLISLAALTMSIEANWSKLIMFPDLAIIGMSPNVSMVSFWASTPDTTKSIKSPLIGI